MGNAFAVLAEANEIWCNNGWHAVNQMKHEENLTAAENR